MRWGLRLSEFDFTAVYKKGKLITQADALSRLHSLVSSPHEIDDDISCFCAEPDSKHNMKYQCKNCKFAKKEEVNFLSAEYDDFENALIASEAPLPDEMFTPISTKEPNWDMCSVSRSALTLTGWK